MSKKKQQKPKKVKEKSTYRNPMDTLGGKILVWFLIIAMVGGVLAGLISILIEIL